MIVILKQRQINLYRTLHPFAARHDGFDWPARPNWFPLPDKQIAANDGSFDVYSRLYTQANTASDGGAIKYTTQEWNAWQRRNGYNLLAAQWAVGGTEQLMMWQDDYLPTFHYPLILGGNFVDVVEWVNQYWARIRTWPKDIDVPDDLGFEYWSRCWCVYKSAVDQIRDAPAGVGKIVSPVFNLNLAHSDTALIFGAGLMKV